MEIQTTKSYKGQANEPKGQHIMQKQSAFYLINDKETTQSNIERKDFSNGVNSTG